MSVDAILVLLVALGIVCLLGWLLYKKNAALKEYSGIIDVDKEIAKRRKEIDKEVRKKETLAKSAESKNAELLAKYKERRGYYEELLKEISVLEEDIEMMDFGVYKPHFDFDTSEKYKKRIADVRAEQKVLIREKRAAVCSTEWTIDGSKVKGRKQTNQQIRLMLRAFNGECDAAIGKVNWNNALKMEARINKSWEIINKNGSSSHITIKSGYRDLKIEELRLAFEYAQKKQDEKEEQRRIKEQMREEEVARREFEKAKKEAETEEKRYQMALEKARKDLETASAEMETGLNQKIADLQAQLAEAHEKKERALSRAQQTKSGHVYVVSNVGSFGEGVFKIGMTRRLEPIDRVKELGDASVPFTFDVHALIYSENAPELENTLHRSFQPRRVNRVNMRKEFFRVTLDEIQSVVHRYDGEIEFTRLAEAREWRETLALIEEEEAKTSLQETVEAQFPAEI